jgi:hypothetical protein
MVVICAAPLDLCARGDWGAVRGAAADRGRANVDWPHFWSLITSESSTTALVLSLKTAAASTALWLLLGVPMALVLARDGRSAVLMSHDLLNVLTLADRVLVLETGQIIETVAGSVCGVNLVGGTADADGVIRHCGEDLAWQPGPDVVADESRWRCSTHRRSPCTATNRTAALATPSR